MAERCNATKANGEQCGAWAVLAGPTCAGHSGLGIARDPATYGRKGQEASLEVRQAKAVERRMSLLDRIAAQIEADASEIVAEYRAAARGGDWRANDALLTRVYGKPVEKVQQVDADPLDVASMSAEQRAALMARVLEDHPGLRVLVPRTAHVPPDALERMDTGDTG